MKMSEKHKSTSSSTMQVKNQRNTITDEEILHIIHQLQKGIPYTIYHNVRLVHSCTYIIHDNADGVRETAKLGTKVFV
jgi:hypothetical protein